METVRSGKFVFASHLLFLIGVNIMATALGQPSFTNVSPFTGHLEEHRTYRGIGPLNIRVHHGEAFHINWLGLTSALDLKPNDILVFQVSKIEKDVISVKRTNITYSLSLLYLFKQFDSSLMPELYQKIKNVAEQEAKVKNLNLAYYNLTIADDDTITDGVFQPRYIASFIDKNALDTGLGNRGHIPALEVHIERDTLRIIRSHFIK